MGKIIWDDRVRKEEVLQIYKEERNITHTIKTRTAKWTGHFMHRKLPYEILY